MKKEHELISSGAIEQYLLGTLDPAQVPLVESAIAADKDLRQEVEQLEEQLEQLALAAAVDPGEKTKKRIMKKIRRRAYDKNLKGLAGVTWMAAGFALLFGLSTLWLYQQQGKQQLLIDQLEEQNTVLSDQTARDQELLQLATQELRSLKDPNTLKYILNGNEKAPGAIAVGYVNHQSKQVVLDAAGLPALEADKDYQLWADVEGEMIDMGVIASDVPTQLMNYIANAESMNITIEPKGGSDHPTVSNLIASIAIQP